MLFAPEAIPKMIADARIAVRMISSPPLAQSIFGMRTRPISPAGTQEGQTHSSPVLWCSRPAFVSIMQRATTPVTKGALDERKGVAWLEWDYAGPSDDGLPFEWKPSDWGYLMRPVVNRPLRIADRTKRRCRRLAAHPRRGRHQGTRPISATRGCGPPTLSGGTASRTDTSALVG